MRSGSVSRKTWIAISVFVLTGLLASGTLASGLGPRVGLTSGPDQVHVGLQMQAATLAPRMHFTPSFEVGLGNDVRLFAANMDFKYSFPARRVGTWRPYVGAGPALHLLDRERVDDHLDVGLSIFGGLQTPRRQSTFFGEMRLGVVDSPDFKFTVGWMFR